MNLVELSMVNSILSKSKRNDIRQKYTDAGTKIILTQNDCKEDEDASDEYSSSDESDGELEVEISSADSE